MMTTKDELLSDVGEVPKPSQTLNVLTILTFIGCGIFGLLTLATPALTGFYKKMMDKAAQGDLTLEQMEKLRKGREAMELAEHNMIPLMVIGMVGIILCFIGALMMRKLKKDGYWLYLAGQIVPFVGNLIILGTSQFQGVGSFVAPLIILVFIILYTTQRKYLVF
jgi:hypothetical protein